jgi:hypothetical protein
MLLGAFESGNPLRLEKPVAQMLESVFVWSGTIMARKDALIEVGLFDEDLIRAQDVHMWIRLARIVDFVFVPTVMALYRQHSGAITQRDEPPGCWGALAYAKLLTEPGFEPYGPAIRRRIGRYMAEDSYYHRAKGNYLEAIRSSIRWLGLAKRDPAAWRNLVASVLGR